MNLLSVVMPCYNSEKYISQAIESVLSQTFTDFEFIIVDDGSTDRTKDIIFSYSDKRIKYIYQQNGGCGIACFIGCKEAQGKYIARIDADDICEPDRFKEQIYFLETHPDYVLVASACTYIDENGIVIGRGFPYTTDRNIKKLLPLTLGTPVTHPSVMFHHDAYKQSGGYLGLKTGQDVILWNKMAKFGKYKNLKKCLIKYRKSTVGLCTDIERDIIFQLAEMRKNMISKTNITDDEIIEYNQLYITGKKKATKRQNLYTTSAEEKLYGFLIPLCGKKLAESLTYLFKNLYGIFNFPHKTLVIK